MGNTPAVPDSYLKYKVTGAEKVNFYIEYKHDTSSWDYEYTTGQSRIPGETQQWDYEPEGKLYLEPIHVSENQRITITAISDTDKRSEPFTFTNQQWWSSLEEKNKDYALEHTFVIE